MNEKFKYPDINSKIEALKGLLGIYPYGNPKWVKEHIGRVNWFQMYKEHVKNKKTKPMDFIEYKKTTVRYFYS